MEVYKTFTAGIHDAVIKPSCTDTVSWIPADASLFSTPACMLTAINMVVSISYNRSCWSRWKNSPQSLQVCPE